ncbi:hypothetical protein ABZ820_02030 [Streptomyces diacarni]|uniref:Alpha/beta hydrolase n=1 Tax=Streptomyces diacarni TaxID=2800381 RepID=A0A367EUE1_9ACTN|nr:hypothetical protein [Streptomyces diacarni]RCG21225.1 hypothetical protein DTL70_17320 [Streptomyces diacarni]
MHPDQHVRSAYDAVLGLWPQDTESIDVTTVHGTTHVPACGPADAPPPLLLHGGFATAAAWYAWDWETGGSQDIAPAYRQVYVAAAQTDALPADFLA